MKQGIHPEYQDAVISCACGNSWATRSTLAEMHIEACSICHPFFTGEQRIIDTAGRVERFRRRYSQAQGPDKQTVTDDQEAAEATTE